MMASTVSHDGGIDSEGMIVFLVQNSRGFAALNQEYQAGMEVRGISLISGHAARIESRKKQERVGAKDGSLR